MARDNKKLGDFRLEGIPSARRGVPKIEVTFDIDANGILNVTAKDTATSKEQRITIQASTNLSDDEISRMVNEAEANAGEDKKRKEEVEIRNNGDALVYQVERQLSDLGDKVPAADQEKTRKLADDLREALKTEDYNQIKAKTEELQQAAYALSTMAYEQADTASAEAAQGPSAASTDDDVIDAEFTPTA